MVVALMVTGCKTTSQEQEMGEHCQLSLCIPAKSMMFGPAHASGEPNRVMGDPGQTEELLLPKYLYVFITKKENDTWKVWQVLSRTTIEENWIKQYYSGHLMGNTDSIYRYTEEIVLPLEQNFEGKVFAVASYKKLTFNQTLTYGASENDLLSLAFNTEPDSIQDNLQHIYSTPYDYEINGSYYGAFNTTVHNVPYLYMILYHVAAKVDIKWNVADTVRIKSDPSQAVRLTRMDVCNLFNGFAYCFKPMENSSGVSPLTTGDTIHIVSPLDEGLWWEGRSYFYTIPYTCSAYAGYFPLQMKMATNDNTTYYRPTLYLNLLGSAPFVPWLRADFNLTRPLTEGTGEKFVD